MNIPFWTLMGSGNLPIFWWDLNRNESVKSHWQAHFISLSLCEREVLYYLKDIVLGLAVISTYDDRSVAHSEKCVRNPFFLIHFIILEHKLQELEAVPDSSFYFSNSARPCFLENVGGDFGECVIQAFLLWQPFCSLTASEMKGVSHSDKLH